MVVSCEPRSLVEDFDTLRSRLAHDREIFGGEATARTMWSEVVTRPPRLCASCTSTTFHSCPCNTFFVM